MEGLIPMLVHALKKQKPHHSFRCLSEGSNRSYHMLIGPQDSVNGSSHHRRTRSEFKPSTADHFLDQRFAPEFSHSNSFNNTNGTRQIGSGTYQVRKETKSYLGRWKNNWSQDSELLDLNIMFVFFYFAFVSSVHWVKVINVVVDEL